MSRSARLKGHTHPAVDPSFRISTVAHRTTNTDETATCVATGAEINTSSPHYFVTFRKPSERADVPDEFEHQLVAIDALEEFEGQLEESE